MIEANTLNIKQLIAASLISSVASWVAVTLYYRDKGFSAKDMLEAQAIGERMALTVKPPSERLEAVCAALWLNKTE